MKIKNILLIFILFFPQSCSIGPEFERPQINAPQSWSEEPKDENLKTKELSKWWSRFHDPELLNLINIALEKNIDVKIASQRIEKAKAERRVVFAGLFPTFDSDGSYSRSKKSQNASSGPGGSSLDSGSFNNNSKYSNLLQGDLGFGWEIDVSGGIRRGLESYDANIQSAEEYFHAVKLMLVAEIVTAYMDLQSTREELRVLENSLEAQKELLEIAMARSKAGLVGDLDVLEAQAEMLTIEAQIPNLKQEEKRLSYRIDGLLGGFPGEYKSSYGNYFKIGNIKSLIPSIIPAHVIEQRPDIKRSLAEVHYRTARIGVAKAEYFPRISLGGSIGYRSSEAGDLVSRDSLFWFLGPSVHIPIFSAGKIQAQVGVATVAQKEAISSYEQTVLRALEEIEVAFVNLRESSKRNDSLRASVLAFSETAELSQQLYQAGIVDFSRVITAKRQLYEAQRALVIGEKKENQALVFLYRALGGGWN